MRLRSVTLSPKFLANRDGAFEQFFIVAGLELSTMRDGRERPNRCDIHPID